MINRSVFSLLFLGVALSAAPTPDQVAALLRNSCASCHSGAQAAGKLKLDTLANLAYGGASGFAVVPGDSAKSLLITRVATGDRALRMPPTGNSLDDAAIDMLKAWIDAGAPGVPRAQVDRKLDYAADVQPLLRAKCYACHSGTQPKSQLRLDAKSGALKGGIGGPAVVPGNSDKSRLIHRVEGRGGEQRMPVGAAALTPDEIALLRTWIDRGAEWPAGKEDALVEKHWSYGKPVRKTPPAATANPVDAFILARLQKDGLQFSPEASKETLIRRLSLDLTGLPPSPAEVDAFVKDAAPNAYEKLVDRLLADPHSAER